MVVFASGIVDEGSSGGWSSSVLLVLSPALVGGGGGVEPGRPLVGGGGGTLLGPEGSHMGLWIVGLRVVVFFSVDGPPSLKSHVWHAACAGCVGWGCWWVWCLVVE